MKTILDEAQVRSALAAIAGTESGGICIIATEMKASDAAVGAAFGAIGAAVAAAGRPNYHIIHRTEAGFYFVPVYVKKSQFILAPAENFFIPHTDIAKFDVVTGLHGGMRIDVKLQNGKKLQFNGNRNVKNAPFQSANFERLYEIYKESSRGAQKKNKITAIVCLVLFVAMIGVIVGLSLSEGEDSPFAEDGSYRMKTETVADVFTLKVPESFNVRTAAELEAYNDDTDSTKLIAAFEHTNQYVGVMVFCAPTGMTNDEFTASMLAEELSEAKPIEINGLKAVQLKGEDTSQLERYEMTVVYFVADGYVYEVLYSCGDSVSEIWSGAADEVMQSISLLSADTVVEPAA